MTSNHLYCYRRPFCMVSFLVWSLVFDVDFCFLMICCLGFTVVAVSSDGLSFGDPCVCGVLLVSGWVIFLAI